MSQLSTKLERDITPYSKETEESLIGAIIAGGIPTLNEVRPLLAVEDFYIHHLGWAYQAACDCADQFGALNYLTVEEMLKDRRLLKEFGGSAYLAGLCGDRHNYALYSYEALGYARIVKRFSWRRRLIAYAEYVGNVAIKQDGSNLDLYHMIEDEFKRLAIPGLGISHSARQLASDLLDEMGRSEGAPIFDGPFNMLNKMLMRGYGPGQYTGIAGYTNSGKSKLLGQLAAHAARKLAVLFVSLESVPSEVFNHMVASESGVPFDAIEDKQLSDSDRAAVVNVASALSECMLEIDMLYSMDAIRARVADMQVKYECPVMVFVDDFDSLASSNSRSKYEAHDRLAVDLLNLSLECGGGVVFSKQLIIPTEARAVSGNDALYEKLTPNIMSVEGGRTIVQKASSLLLMYSSDWIRQKIRAEFQHPELPPGQVQFLGVRFRKRKAAGALSGFLHWNPDVPRFEDIGTGQVTTKRYEQLDSMLDDRFVMGRTDREDIAP